MVAAADGAQVRASCPRCGAALNAEPVRVVAATDRALLEALLDGRLNLIECPACRTAVRIMAPLLFHDPDSAQSLVYLPDGLSWSHEQQQRTIGDLANLAMRMLPDGAPRGHLLQPTLFLTPESFHEAVLVASGVSREDIEAVREMTRLIERLLDLADGEDVAAALRDSAYGDDPRLVRLSRELAARSDALGDRARGERLRALAAQLGALVAPQAVELDDLIAALAAARDQGQLEDLVLQIRPALDYTFFAALTERHAAASGAPDEGEPGPNLLDLRAAVLTAIDAVDGFERRWAESARAWVEQLVAATPQVRPGLVRLMALAGILDPMFFSVVRGLRNGGSGHPTGGDGKGDVHDRSSALEAVEALARQAMESIGDGPHRSEEASAGSGIDSGAAT